MEEINLEIIAIVKGEERRIDSLRLRSIGHAERMQLE